MELNKLFIIGRLTADPELHQTQNGKDVCSFCVANNQNYKTKSGDLHEETCFVDVTSWSGQARSCSEYLYKGAKVLVEGRLKLDQWQDKDTGRNRSRLSVTADSVTFIDVKRDDDRSTSDYDYDHRCEEGRESADMPF